MSKNAMKKAMLHVPFEEEKLTAARLYMEQKELSFEDEMSKAAEVLYGKYVPANVREFIELRSQNAKTAAKSQKPRSSSVVGGSRTLEAVNISGGDSD